MSDELIHLNKINKKYGHKQILNDISLTIEKGQSIALLGHNGSGKSTLLRIICGLTKASSGEIKYSKKLKFNYIPELFPKMNITVEQYIKHMGLIEGIPEQILDQKCQELFQLFYMDNMTDIPLNNLSKGTLQKVAVIQALLSTPDILLLDEPLSGQDVQSQKKFITLIRELNQQGVTIIMSCHEMFLVNQISDIAYEIKNHRLEPFEIDKTKNYEFDVLLFEKKDDLNAINKMNRQANSLFINKNIVGLVQKTDLYQDEIRLVVSRENSSEVIMQMLKDGFLLRAMKGIDE